MKKVSDIMSTGVQLARPDQTLRDAAAAMAEADIGSLPVSENDRIVGMITDRDIALRGVARGLGPDTPIRDVMSKDIKYCFESDSIDKVARNMAELQVRRLPVVNDDKRLVGIIALSNISQCGDEAITDKFLHGVATPH